MVALPCSRTVEGMEERTAFDTFRRRITAWLVAMVALALLALILTTRTAMLAAVSDAANRDVVQETEEFGAFIEEGLDPETSKPFTSAERMLEVYLSRQIPGEDEAIVGVVGGQLVQMANSPRPLSTEDPMVQEAVAARASTGVFEDADAGPVHWGKVTVAGVDDTALLVARYTDTARAQVAGTVRIISLISLGALVLSAALAMLVAGRLLAPVRAERHARDAAYEGTLARLETQVRAVESADATRIMRAINTVRPAPDTPAEVLEADEVGRAIERHLLQLDLPITVVQTPQEHAPVKVDVAALAHAAEEAARFCATLSTPLEAGIDCGSDKLSVWVRERDTGCDADRLEKLLQWPPSEYPEGKAVGMALVRMVADQHGGSAWAESTRGLGTIVGIDVPLAQVSA